MLQPLAIGDVEDRAGLARHRALAVVEHRLVEDHVVQAAVGPLDLGLVDLPAAAGQQLAVGLVVDGGQLRRCHVVDRLADDLLAWQAKEVDKSLVATGVAALGVLREYRRRDVVQAGLHRVDLRAQGPQLGGRDRRPAGLGPGVAQRTGQGLHVGARHRVEGAQAPPHVRVTIGPWRQQCQPRRCQRRADLQLAQGSLGLLSRGHVDQQQRVGFGQQALQLGQQAGTARRHIGERPALVLPHGAQPWGQGRRRRFEQQQQGSGRERKDA